MLGFPSKVSMTRSGLRGQSTAIGRLIVAQPASVGEGIKGRPCTTASSPVLSYHELVPTLRLEPVGKVSVPEFPLLEAA